MTNGTMNVIYEDPLVDEITSCSFFGMNKRKEQNQQHDHAAVGERGFVDPDEQELAREMNELSVKERERVLDDIHGVAETPEETPEFISKRLNELDLYISRTPKSKRKAYDKALFCKPTIDSDKKFKIMFLRADLYDAKKAAQRMMKFFEDKQYLFGENKVAKDITLGDLSDEDMKIYGTGCFLVLPHKDQVGRPIWFFDTTRYEYDHTDSMIRCCWYMIMKSLEGDETAQLKGGCNVAYAPGDVFAKRAPISKVNKLLSKGGDILINLPMRITSYHFCYTDTRMIILLSLLRKCFGKQVRMRTRVHYGSDLEMQYSLATFGIQCGKLLESEALNEEEDAKKQLHKRYIQRRIGIEEQENLARIQQESSSGIILYPQLNDVLVGRGRPYQSFPGNIRFGRLIEEHNDVYHKCSDKFTKTCMSIDIVKRVQEYGGRFIERTKTGTWKVIDDLQAREKTAIGFRSRVSKVTRIGNETTGMKSPRTFGDDVSTSSAKRFRYDPAVTVSS